MTYRLKLNRAFAGLLVGAALSAAPTVAQEVNSHSLAENGWFSDDTRADGFGTQAAGTNLISDTLTDAPENGGGSSAHDADILSMIQFMPAPGSVPAGTHLGAVHLNIGNNGSGKAQISHRKDDGTGHFPGSALSAGFTAEYSWMGDGVSTVTASLKFGVKTAEFGSIASPSSRTGENVWDKVLIYEPGQGNGKVADGTWQTETIDFTTGNWWFFDRNAGAATIGTPLTLSDMSTSAVLVGGGPKTIADVYALITAPGAHITSVQFGIGSGNANGSVYVNQLETNVYRPGMVTTFACGEPFYANGFEDDDFGWNVFGGAGFASARVPSGTNGVISAGGSWHSETTATAAGNWGGYSGICGCASTTCAATADVFPLGGYTTSIDIWLDVDGGYANDSNIDFSSAVNNGSGSHRRDFMFNGVFLDSTDFTGPGAGGVNRFVWAASNNSPGFPQGGVDPIVITESGWYTFENRFYDSGAGVLACDFVILDSDGDEVASWTRSNGTDVIGSTVGGNRYGWFVTNELGSIAFDNAGRRPGPFDQNVTPDTIFGTGNFNGSFTVDRQDGVELGIRGKLRFPASSIYNSNGDGTYTFNTGSGTSTAPNAEWAWDWSVNTDYDDSTGRVIQDLDYEMGIDFDPGAGTNYLVFDPIAPGSVIPYTVPEVKAFWDHSIGDNTTGVSMGVEATDVPTYLALIAANNVAQNSWRSTFYNQPPFAGFDPNVPGRYEIYLSASDNGEQVARTQISIFAIDGVTLSLEGDVNQADQLPGTPGVQVATELWLRNPMSDEVTGWQAFLSFNDALMTYEGAVSSYTAAPFSSHIQSAATANVAPGELRLDGNTLPSLVGTMDDVKLATLYFTVAECTPVSVAFDLGQPFASETSFFGSPLVTDLLDGPSVVPDDTAPVLMGTPADITQPADAGSCAMAVVTWTDPTATDNCDPSPVVECSPPSGSVFPVGTTTVTCTATDVHGNESTSTFDVTVTATNAVNVVVELPGSDPTTRCIEFVADCGASTSVMLNFVGSPATATATIEMPCGVYTNLCAKDEQHTLWDSTTLSLTGASYTADSTLVLAGGDTDDDGDVDINDVTLLLAQFGTVPAIGPCPWDGVTRNADFSNNGPVGSEDYVFVTANWLATSACTCPSPIFGRGGAGPQTRITVVDSLSRAADLNRDGFVDVLDVEVLEQRHGLSGELSKRMRR